MDIAKLHKKHRFPKIHYLCKRKLPIMGNFRLYSIGHSSQTQEEFLALLVQHGVNCIVDVRSVPASKYAPQFNQEVLKGFLKRNGVQYLSFGDEFGARRTDSFDEDGLHSCAQRPTRLNAIVSQWFRAIFMTMVSTCNTF